MFHFVPCGKCENGYIRKKGAYIACECLKKYNDKTKLYRALVKANIISYNSNIKTFNSISKLTLDQYLGPDERNNLEKIQKFIQFFGRRYSDMMLFFSGKPGTQKTTLAKYIGKELIQSNYSVYFVLANSLIQSIISAERDEADRNKLEKILTVDFLIIDEMDDNKIVTYQSGWQRKHFHPWLKERLETIKKSTLFISNRAIDDLGDYFDEATKDLINRVVPDKTMIFEDVYMENQEPIKVEDIWK